MTPHTHRERVDGCYRCELSADEVVQVTDKEIIAEALAKYHGYERASLIEHQESDAALAALAAEGRKVVGEQEWNHAASIAMSTRGKYVVGDGEAVYKGEVVDLVVEGVSEAVYDETAEHHARWRERYAKVFRRFVPSPTTGGDAGDR